MARWLSICFFFFLTRASNVLSEGETKCYGRFEVPKCVTDCPPEKTCKTMDVEFDCLQGDESCQMKCVCEDNYFRNQLGECISRENCDRCPGEHEYLTCSSSFCDNVCSELHKQNKTHCSIRSFHCNNNCYCEDNYARDDEKNCIPIEDCKKTKSKRDTVIKEEHCGPNEEYKQCITTAHPELCSTLEKSLDNPKDLPCVPGCQCQDGYLRIEEGSACIPMHECPQLVHMPGYK